MLNYLHFRICIHLSYQNIAIFVTTQFCSNLLFYSVAHDINIICVDGDDTDVF